MGAVAYRWKTQLNENAKMHAFSHALPELAHNEIVGWEGTLPGRFAAVFLSDPGQPDAVRRSIEATAELIAGKAALIETVTARGETPAARAFSLVARGAGRRRPRGRSRSSPAATGPAMARPSGEASTRPRCATSTCSRAP